MILGIDHVAIATNDVDASAAVLEESGYRTVFVERSLLNVDTKSPLLRYYQPRHAIRYCACANGPALELTDYGCIHDAEGAGYDVLLSAPLADMIPASEPSVEIARVWADTLGCERIAAARSPRLHLRYWYDAAGRDPFPRVVGLLRRVGDLAAASAFWETRLAARRVGSGNASGVAWVRLAFSAPITQWRVAVVLCDGAATPGYLDDTGFPCVALLTSNLARDRARIVASTEMESTRPFEIAVAGRTLTVEILRAPAGELIELIEITRTEQ